MEEKNKRRAAFVFVFITVVLDMLAVGMIVPVLPKLLIQMEGGDLANAAVYTGFFAFVWALMQFICSPILGACSDRFGRRPVILLSNLGSGIDYLFMALAPSLAWLLVGRILSGIASATFATASAYISDVTPPEERAKSFGFLGAAFGVGFIVGPAVGGLLGSITLRCPFWVAGVLSLLNALYGYFILPESLSPDDRSPLSWKELNPFSPIKKIFFYPSLIGLLAISGLHYIAHEVLPSTFVLYADYRYAWDEKTIGMVLACAGISSMLVSIFLVGPMVKRWGEERVLQMALACGVLGFLCYGVAETGLFFLIGIPFVALWGVVGPVMQSLMSQKVSTNEQGRLQGMLSAVRGFCGMFSPLLFTQLFVFCIEPSRALRQPGGAFYLAALFLFCGLILSFFLLRSDLLSFDDS